MNIAQIKQYLTHNLWHGEQERKRDPLRSRFTSLSILPNVFKVWGVDVSLWNIPPVDLPRMVQDFGMSFAIFKGCDGSLNSRYYPEHVAQAKAAGIPWGMYVWLYPNGKVSIDAQVNAWHARFIADPPPMGLFIDAEWTTYAGLPANPTAADLRLAHDKWRAKSGQKAITYTAKGYADAYLVGFDWTREELWVANYGVSSPNLPKGATAWTFWQFSSTLDGAVLDPNGNKELDGNYFVGSKSDFEIRYGTVEQPPTGGTMKKWKTTVPLNMRTAPTVADNIIQALPQNAFFWGEPDAVAPWVKGTHYQLPGEPYAVRRDFYIFASTQYSTELAYTEPILPPASDIASVRFSGEVVFDYTDGRQEVYRIEDADMSKVTGKP